MERLWQTVRIVYTVRQQLRERHIYLLAAGIAFNVGLCFVPMGLVALWMFAALVPADFVAEALERVLVGVLVPTEQLRSVLHSVLEQLEVLIQRRLAAGAVGVVALVWTASALLKFLRVGLQAAFQLPSPPRRRLVLWERLRDVVVMVALLGLTLVMAVVLIGWSLVTVWGTSFLPEGWRGGVRWALGAMASILTEGLLFGFVFGFVPMVRLPVRQVAVAVGSAVVLTELVRIGYVWYLEHLAPWGWVYGGYAALVSLVVWAYAVAFIILCSGVVSTVVGSRRS